MKIHRWNELLGKDEDFDAVVLSTEGGAVFQIGDQITYGFPGRVSFPSVPPNLISKPTLVWLLGSGVAKQKVEVTYLTQNLNWRSDYVLVVDENDAIGDLQGWVTLTNTSGASYENAKLKLVAGDVQRGVGDEDADGLRRSQARKRTSREVRRRRLLRVPPLHARSADHGARQRAEAGVAVGPHGHREALIFFGADYYYRGNYGQVVSNQKVGVYLDVQNEEKTTSACRSRRAPCASTRPTSPAPAVHRRGPDRPHAARREDPREDGRGLRRRRRSQADRLEVARQLQPRERVGRSRCATSSR